MIYTRAEIYLRPFSYVVLDMSHKIEAPSAVDQVAGSAPRVFQRLRRVVEYLRRKPGGGAEGFRRDVGIREPVAEYHALQAGEYLAQELRIVLGVHHADDAGDVPQSGGFQRRPYCARRLRIVPPVQQHRRTSR